MEVNQMCNWLSKLRHQFFKMAYTTWETFYNAKD